MARELCTRAQVTAYAPGYTTDAATDALLDRLITSESRSFHDRSKREIVSIAGQNPRRFDVGEWEEAHRQIAIGDVTTITSVAILDANGATLETVAAASRVSLPRVLEEWEPIRWLYFPADVTSPVSNLIAGRIVEVNAAAWGFPAVPADVQEAVASMVLARYVEIIPSGTLLAESLAEVNIAALFRNAQDVLADYAKLAGLVRRR